MPTDLTKTRAEWIRGRGLSRGSVKLSPLIFYSQTFSLSEINFLNSPEDLQSQKANIATVIFQRHYWPFTCPLALACTSPAETALWRRSERTPARPACLTDFGRAGGPTTSSDLACAKSLWQLMLCSPEESDRPTEIGRGGAAPHCQKLAAFQSSSSVFFLPLECPDR